MFYYVLTNSNKRTLVNLLKDMLFIVVSTIPTFSVRRCLPTTHKNRDPNSYSHSDVSKSMLFPDTAQEENLLF